MSKLSKLFKRPRLFFKDALAKRRMPEKKNVNRVSNKNLEENTNIQASSETLFKHFKSDYLEACLKRNKAVYLYLPWIQHHGDALIKNIPEHDSFEILPFEIFSENIYDVSVRRKLSKYIRENPDVYSDVIVAQLIPIKDEITGFIFTFDWAPVMRLIVQACRILDIPTVLLPHESVFADREKYYLDITAKGSVPQVDYILGWGELHKDIFGSRGFDVTNRFEKVGSVKFDMYKDFKSKLSKEQFCQVFGLDPAKKICLFAAQPLDSQYSVKAARDSQRQAIKDVHKKCLNSDAQLLLRLPPSGDNILNSELRNLLEAGEITSIDKHPNYLVSPSEALYHADVTLSLNSTMLFEAILLGRASVTMQYTKFDSIWKPVGLPSPKNHSELSDALEAALSGEWKPREEGVRWAADAFGTGEFDGKAGERISDKLADWVQSKPPKKSRTPVEKILIGDSVDVVAIPSSSIVQNSSQKYLQHFVNSQTVISTHESFSNLKLSQLSSVDIFFQWGLQPSTSKSRQQDIAKKLRRSIVYLEDGFIRSVNIGLSGEPSLSIIVDDISPYYNAKTKTKLQCLLDECDELSGNEYTRIRQIIDTIVNEKISKYNHAPLLNLDIGDPEKPKILLIDQRFGDQSVYWGLADENTFEKMLTTALTEFPGHDLIIKLHPDATSGEKHSYFNHRLLDKFSSFSNIYVIGFEVNPYCLFDIAEKVFVCTSGVGFEAIMAGKEVHCFGVPFYSNRGLTVDHVTSDHRSKKVSLEQLFHVSYIKLSRYFSPELQRRCEIEDLVDYIIKNRNTRKKWAFR